MRESLNLANSIFVHMLRSDFFTIMRRLRETTGYETLPPPPAQDNIYIYIYIYIYVCVCVCVRVCVCVCVCPNYMLSIEKPNVYT